MFPVMRPHFESRLTRAWVAGSIMLAALLLGSSIGVQSAEAQTHYGIEGSYTINMIMTSKPPGIEDTKQFDITMSGLKFAFTGTSNGFDIYKVTAGRWKVVGQYTVLAPCGQDPIPNHLYIDGDFSGQGTYPSAQEKLILRVPVDRVPGAKARINAEFGPEAITCTAKIYDCEGSESPYSYQTGLKWTNQPAVVTSLSSPPDTFTVRASSKITRPIGLVTVETWPLLNLYTRFVKAPPVVKPTTPRVRATNTSPDPLAPLVVESSAANPNGIEGSVELAPLVPQSQSLEDGFRPAAVIYGRAIFAIPKNTTSKRVNIKLTPQAMLVLNQDKPIQCTAVIKAADMLGNSKITRTPLTILPPN